jgi:transcription antitermination factor NusG
MDESARTTGWYALKVFFNKVFDIEDLLAGAGFETYVPVRKVELKGEEFLRVKRRLALQDDDRNDRKYEQVGPRIYRRETVVTSLAFVKASEEDLPWIRNQLEGKGFVYMTADRKRPAVIPDRQMAMFRLVASSGEEGLEFFSEERLVNYAQGDRVRVKEGPLKGAEGYIKRIRRDRRLLVAIEGFIAVATSYIPPELLEKV